MKCLLSGLGMVAGVLLVGGCGGVSVSGEQGGERAYGPISTRAVGGVGEPITMTTSQAAVVGVFGANFTSLTVNLPPENQLNEETLLGSTLIAFSSINRPFIHDMANGATYVVNPDVPIFGNSCSPSIHFLMESVASSEYESASGAFQIYTTNLDGSGRARLTSGGAWKTNPRYSPTASRIVFEQGSDIWAVNRDGTGLTQLTATADPESTPAWSPNGSLIYYYRTVGGAKQIWRMNSNGTGQTFVMSAVGAYGLDINPAGTECVYASFSGSYYIYRARLDGTGTTSVLSSPNYIDSVSWAPTGSHLAFAESVAGTLTVKTLRLRDGQQNVVRLLDGGEYAPKWGPLVRRRLMVGATSALLNTNAAGFLYGMRGPNFSSLVAFDALTRNTVDIDTAPNNFNSATLFATITAADAINMLRYVNSFAGTRITVVDPANASTHVQGAVVGFDGVTGQVSVVLPFNRSRSGDKPERVEDAGKITFRGNFTGVFDASGKKTENAISEATFDAQSGKLIEAR